MGELFIELKDAWLCPECETLRQGPGACRCGEPETVYVGLSPLRDTLKSGTRRKALREAAGRVFYSGTQNLKERLPETFCRTCPQALNCLDGGPLGPCPQGLREGKAA